MSLLKGEGEASSQFTTLLRINSGQETEPEFVLVEHSYARPWNWQSESSNSHPRKTLFLSKLPRTESEDIIDVVKDFPSNTAIPYDLVRGRHLMSECERHVVIAKLNRAGGKDEENEVDIEDSDWEQSVNKSGWTDSQHYIFNRVVKILDADRLARLTLKDVVNEPIKRRVQIDKTAAKFRQTLGRANWDLKLTQWLHNTLLQNMSTPYLAAYLDILQTLKSKIPNLVDKVISFSNSQKGPNIEALNLLLKRPWDPAVPVLSQQKPCKLENLPIVIQVPSGTTSPNVPQASRRIRFFNSQLQHMAKCIPVSVASEASNPASISEQLICEVQMRIVDCKTQYPSHPIVLLGWGVGAALACHISLIEKVSANVCLGFPIMDHMGKRGEADDPLLDMRTPTLFIIGEKATNATVDDIEDFRYHMQAETSLVIIAGADLLLKMSLEKRYWDGLTQSMVDRCIVDEIGDFLTRTFNEDNKPPPASSMSCSQISFSGPPIPFSHSSAFTNPSLPPKLTKRDVGHQRKRKLSPMSLADSASLQVPPKIMRTGTAISQTLGLKIPVGVSSAASFMKQEGRTIGSPVATISGEVEDFLPTDSGVDSLQKCKAVRRVSDSASLSYKSPFSSNRAGPIDATINTKPRASISPCPFDSSSVSTLSVSRASLTSLSVSGGSPTFATIPLGSFASLTRQRHQQMMQISENPDLQQVSSWPLAKTSTMNPFDWRAANPKVQEDTDSDVDICGLSSVASTPAGATDSPSTRDFGKGSALHVEGVPFPQEKQYLQSSRCGVEASTSGHILVTSSLVSATPAIPAKVPGPTKRGRPPGRPKGSTNANLHSKGRGKEPNTSMAVLTFTGAAGNGSGVESAGKGISSLGRGVLTLSKGGTSTVRVYSASGQKLSSSPGAAAVATNAASSGSQKSRGFLLTNISAAPSGSLTGAPEKSSAGLGVAVSGRVNSCKAIANSDAGVRVTTTNTSGAAIVTATTTSGQVSLNLQGISASRAVSFGSARPTAVMLLPSSSTPTSAVSSVTATNTTTTISSGGLKTTKSVIGVQPSVETLGDAEAVSAAPEQRKSSARVDTDAEVASKPPEFSLEMNASNPENEREPSPSFSVPSKGPDEEGCKDNVPVGSSSVGDKTQPRDTTKPRKYEIGDSDNCKSVLATKAQKTLVLGTKVAPSSPRSPARKSNITFISSKALSKVLPSSDKLPVSPSVQAKSLLKANPTCAFLKMSPKTSSIRLVRSVGAPLSASGTLKGALSNPPSVGNIVTKTFTISSNPTKDLSVNKRRVSLDSATSSVSKRSRGTSTDQMMEGLIHKDPAIISAPPLSSVVPELASDAAKPSIRMPSLVEQSLDKSYSTEKNTQEVSAPIDTTSSETSNARLSTRSAGENKSSDSVTLVSSADRNTNRPKIFRQLSATKKPSAKVPSPVTKIVCPPKGQTLIISSKENVTANIKVTKELLTTSVTPKSSTSSSVPFQDREYFNTQAIKEQEHSTSCSGSFTSLDYKEPSTFVEAKPKHISESLKTDSLSFPLISHSSLAPSDTKALVAESSLKVKVKESSAIMRSKANISPLKSSALIQKTGQANPDVRTAKVTSKSSSFPLRAQESSSSPSKSKRESFPAIKSNSETAKQTYLISDMSSTSVKPTEIENVKERTGISVLKDPWPSKNDNKEAPRTRRDSLILLKSSNTSHLSSAASVTPSKRNKPKDEDSSSPGNRITRSTAKTAASETKRHLRSGF